MFGKFYMSIFNIKREIDGQKIKVEKSVFRFQLCSIMFN